jgi:hypothetical protein
MPTVILCDCFAVRIHSPHDELIPRPRSSTVYKINSVLLLADRLDKSLKQFVYFNMTQKPTVKFNKFRQKLECFTEALSRLNRPLLIPLKSSRIILSYITLL